MKILPPPSRGNSTYLATSKRSLSQSGMPGGTLQFTAKRGV
jgi:hypothetical protein